MEKQVDKLSLRKIGRILGGGSDFINNFKKRAVKEFYIPLSWKDILRKYAEEVGRDNSLLRDEYDGAKLIYWENENLVEIVGEKEGNEIFKVEINLNHDKSWSIERDDYCYLPDDMVVSEENGIIICEVGIGK